MGKRTLSLPFKSLTYQVPQSLTCQTPLCYTDTTSRHQQWWRPKEQDYWAITSHTCTCLVTVSMSKLNTSPSRVSTWNTWQPQPRVVRGWFWDYNHTTLSSATIEASRQAHRNRGCTLQVITRKRMKPSLGWMSKCTTSTFYSVTAFCIELENKPRQTQSSTH